MILEIAPKPGINPDTGLEFPLEIMQAAVEEFRKAIDEKRAYVTLCPSSMDRTNPTRFTMVSKTEVGALITNVFQEGEVFKCEFNCIDTDAGKCLREHLQQNPDTKLGMRYIRQHYGSDNPTRVFKMKIVALHPMIKR